MYSGELRTNRARCQTPTGSEGLDPWQKRADCTHRDIAWSIKSNDRPCMSAGRPGEPTDPPSPMAGGEGTAMAHSYKQSRPSRNGWCLFFSKKKKQIAKRHGLSVPRPKHACVNLEQRRAASQAMLAACTWAVSTTGGGAPAEFYTCVHVVSCCAGLGMASTSGAGGHVVRDVRPQASRAEF